MIFKSCQKMICTGRDNILTPQTLQLGVLKNLIKIEKIINFP